MRRLLLALVVGLMSTGCFRAGVSPGEIALKINSGSEDYTVDEDNLVGPGGVLLNPWTEEIIRFPRSIQTLEAIKTDEKDDSIDFNSLEGTQINADVAVNFSFIPVLVPALYDKYRKTFAELRRTVIQQEVSDAFNRIGGKTSLQQIYGKGKWEFLAQILIDLNTKLGPDGFKFRRVSFRKHLRLPEAVQEAMDQVVVAQNRASAADALVRQREAEAQQNLVIAGGELEVAQVWAQTNERLAASLTPEVIQYLTLRQTQETGFICRVPGD